MKNENVVKINKLGKVSRIIVSICIVIVIIGLAAAAVSEIAVASINFDGVKIEGTANAVITVDHDSIPKNMINVEESSFDSSVKGIGLKWIVNSSTENNITKYTIDGAIKDPDGNAIKAMLLVAIATAIVFLICFLIALIHGKKLAQALEVCDSPFEPVVLSRMKGFSKSLIPWVVVSIIVNGISAFTVVLSVLVVFLFVNIFNYGAQLQKEADETL